MRMTRFSSLAAVIAFAGLAASCSDSSGPGDTQRPPAELNVLALAPDSPPLFNPADSFYARRGEDRELRIFFQDPEHGGAGEEYLRLRVDAPSLLARPDGSPIAEGDSVLIHVQVVDAGRLLFEMQPSGLRFSPDRPARLTIHYAHCNGDFNDDGQVDGEDQSIEPTLGIWRQETPADAFVRLGAVLSADQEEAEADLEGFSRYALAY